MSSVILGLYPRSIYHSSTADKCSKLIYHYPFFAVISDAVAASGNNKHYQNNGNKDEQA
jgi:hypothetical protein